MTFFVCPGCDLGRFSAKQKVVVCFFGGELLCDRCGAISHLNYTWLWTVGGAILPLLIIAGYFVVMATLEYWFLLIPLFLAVTLLGVVGAIVSPLKAVYKEKIS